MWIKFHNFKKILLRGYVAQMHTPLAGLCSGASPHHHTDALISTNNILSGFSHPLYHCSVLELTQCDLNCFTFVRKAALHYILYVTFSNHIQGGNSHKCFGFQGVGLCKD